MLLFGLEKDETDMDAFGREIQRMEKLVDDLWRVSLIPILKSFEIPDAPLLDHWLPASRTVPCLMGLTTGHPELTGQGRAIITSDLVLFSESAGFARTRSRWYRLGKKSNGGGNFNNSALKDIDMETRMFRYLLARLRHEAWRRSIRVAIDAGFVDEKEKSIDDSAMRIYHSRSAIPDSRMRNFKSLLCHLNVNRNKAIATGKFDDDELPEDDAWSGRWEEPDPGSRKLTGYRPGSQSPRDQTAAMSTISRRREPRPTCEQSTENGSILHRIRAAGRLLSPVDVATTLLVTKAIEELGFSAAEASAKLSEPGLVISVFGGVEGFEASFMSLIKRGIFGPPSVALVDGTTIGKSGSFVYPKRTAVSRQVIMFPGSETDAKYADLADWQLGKAAELGVPVLGVTEGTALLPERMLPASSLLLVTGPLTSSIVGETIALVLGATAQDTLEDRCCALLTLTDLALAIRPGAAPGDATSILQELALSRTGDQSAKSGASGIPGTNQNTKTLHDSGGRYRKPIHSGSEIIQPQHVADAKHTVPSIETLAGYGEAKTWAMNLKVDLDLWKAGKTPWADLSSKILLCGPPGTGKTLFAKALTNSLGIPLYVTSVGIWLEAGHLHDVLERMHAVFAEARAASPCILFIDEIDGIGRRRAAGRGTSDLWNNVVTRLLELLNGTVKSTGVVIVGATNNQELIDRALLRSGRLGKPITIPLPDVDALAEILRFHLAGDMKNGAASCDAKSGPTPLALDSDMAAIRRLAGLAIGKTGADIEHVVHEARQAARRDQRPFTIADVEARLGKDKPTKTDAIRKLSAIHEAGHAIACLAFGWKTIKAITINGSEGRCYLETSDAIDDGSAQAVCDGIVTWLAGRAAEEVLLGHVSRGSGGSSESDLAKATEMACSLETSYGFNAEHPLLYLGSIEPFSLLAGRQDIAYAVNERLEACYEIAKDLIGRNRDAVNGLAAMLLEHETLEGAMLRNALDGLIIL